MMTLLTMIGTFILFLFVALIFLIGGFLSSPAGFEFAKIFNFVVGPLPGYIIGGILFIVIIAVVFIIDFIIMYLIGFLIENVPILSIVRLAVGAVVPYWIWEAYPNQAGLICALIAYLITAIIVWWMAWEEYRVLKTISQPHPKAHIK